MVKQRRTWKHECKCPLYLLVVSFFLIGIILTVYGRVHVPFHASSIQICEEPCQHAHNDDLKNMARANIAGPIVLVCGLLMVYVVFKYSRWLQAVELDFKERSQIEQRFKNMVTVPASSSQSKSSGLSSGSNYDGYAVNHLSSAKPTAASTVTDNTIMQDTDNSLPGSLYHDGYVVNFSTLNKPRAMSLLTINTGKKNKVTSLSTDSNLDGYAINSLTLHKPRAMSMLTDNTRIPGTVNSLLTDSDCNGYVVNPLTSPKPIAISPLTENTEIQDCKKCCDTHPLNSSLAIPISIKEKELTTARSAVINDSIYSKKDEPLDFSIAKIVEPKSSEFPDEE